LPLPALLAPLLLAFAPAAPAQKIDFPKPRTQPPPAEQAEAAQAGEPEEAAADATPEVLSHWDLPGAEALDPRVVAVLREFEAEEDRGAEARSRYLSRLRTFGLDSPRAAALHALTSLDPSMVELAAELLEFVGEPEDANALVSTASGVGVVPVATTCLEVALRLNGGWLPARAVRLLDHPKRGVRSAAEARLDRLADDSFLKPLLQKLRTGRDHDTRLRAARLLRGFRERPEVRLALHEALLDPSVPVSFEAAETLAGEADPEALELLRQDLSAAEPGLQQAYLLFALLRQGDILNRLLIDEPLLPMLRDALREPDLFLSGAAAACLAEYLFRSTDIESLRELEGEIVHTLVRAIGGVEFYPQYARFSKMGEASLIRVTGEDFSHLGRGAWLAWFAQNQTGFRAVRGRLEVREADLPRLRISWQHGEGPLRCLAGRDAGHDEAELRLLGAIGMVQLLERIEQAQLLDVRVLPGIYGSSSQPVKARIELQVGDQRKPLTFRGDSGADWLPGLLRDLDALFGTLAWQALAPAETPEAFVLEHLEDWDKADANGRRVQELALTLERLALLSGDELEAWCAYLAADPELDPLWDAELGGAFLAAVPMYAARPELAGALLEAALRQPHPELADPFIETLAEMGEPLRSQLLQQGMLAFGPDVAAEAMRDQRLPVRVAAARALGNVGPAGLEALLEALRDSNALVVQMAARSLGQLGDPAVVGQLIPLTGAQHSKGVRGEALWALGEIGDPEALEAVRGACGLDQESPVRLAAIQALGKLDGDGVAPAFTELFPLFAGGELELSWSRSLERRGAAEARAVLSQHQAAADPVVASRAAVLAGRLGDPEAVGRLIQLLPFSPHDGDLLDALVTSTGVDYRGTPDPAGVYAAWWSENGLLEPAFWLERAAANSGYLLPQEFELAERVPPAEAVAKLVDLLEGGPVRLRPMASYYLELLTGLDRPAFRPETTFEEVQAAAAAWRAWSDARADG